MNPAGAASATHGSMDHGTRTASTTGSMPGMVTTRPAVATARITPRIGKILDGKNLVGLKMEKPRTRSI